MTVCPVAIVSGCRKCPAFKICPLKTVLGDYRPDGKNKTASGDHAAKSTKGAQARKK